MLSRISAATELVDLSQARDVVQLIELQGFQCFCETIAMGFETPVSLKY
jgi:hypothetical protein